MAEDAWGRWGEADEAGAVNLIGAAQVVAAAELVREGRVLSLAQPISPRMPISDHRAPLQHFMARDGGDYAAGARARGGFQFAEDTVIMSLHTGTHVDALCHCWYGDHLYNGHSGNSVRSVSRAERCGIEKMPPTVTRGVLVDCVAARGGPLADGEAIGAAEIQAVLARTGIVLRQGDAVLLRTGWQERALPGGPVDYGSEPGLDVAAAEWLAGQDIALVGADNFAIEAMPFPQGEIFPVHQRLIRDFGIPLLEGLLLTELADSGAAEFLFMLAPLPVKGGTASPVTPLAVL